MRPWWFFVVRDLGFPVAACLGLGFVTVKYFIIPAQDERTKLFDSTVIVQKQMTETLSRISQAQTELITSIGTTQSLVASNAVLIQRDIESGAQVSKLIESAKEMMKDVPADRKEANKILLEIRDSLKKKETIP